MIKSLYIRIVLMFLSAIVVSLVTSAIITGYLYEKSVQEQTQDSMVLLGQGLIRIYDRAGFDNRALVMNDIRDLTGAISVEIFDGSGKLEMYGSAPEADIPDDQVNRVLQGQDVRGRVGRNDVYVGLSFENGGERYALFIQPNSANRIGYPVNDMIWTMIGIVLAGGSLFFIVEAGFLVQPLRKMTEATRRMAKGDFSTDLKVKRKDELGVLVQSFDEMRRQLRQLEQMRQDFVSNVSHEIQSPLTSIRGFAKALKEEQLDAEARDRYLDIIMAESERMSRMSENLLKLASLESEHHPFHPVTYRLDEQLRQTVVAFEPQWSAKRIRMDLELPVVQIAGDRDGLEQVWINLIGNSLKFTPEEGTVSIRLRQDVNQVVVSIRDTGIGISEEDQPHMFERFYKADRSRSRAQGGNGLGLAIAKKIVGLHQGTIAVRSRLGAGTEISVTLPYHSYRE
ncbi:ATP-binding protein [Paenibacillus macerans]|uniref:sensor histidine kinase n=1 Tax=Paenibacillus macerans TaxID=44252 RepID=UPI003D314992